MTEAWFMLALLVAGTMSSNGVGPSSLPAFASELACLDAIPARADRLRQINSGKTIPAGALGFVCVRGVRR